MPTCTHHKRTLHGLLRSRASKPPKAQAKGVAAKADAKAAGWRGEGAGEGPWAGQRSWAKWRTPAPRAAACDHQKMGALSTSATTTTTSTTSTTSTTAAGTPTTTTATKVPQGSPLGTSESEPRLQPLAEILQQRRMRQRKRKSTAAARTAVPRQMTEERSFFRRRCFLGRLGEQDSPSRAGVPTGFAGLWAEGLGRGLQSP